MPQKEKATEEKAKSKKRPTKGAGKKSLTEKETGPKPAELDRDQLESLRDKLQRKYH